MITRYIKGDITETELKFIAHGVNCQGVMGSGVAKSLFTLWPKVRDSYLDFYENQKGQYRNFKTSNLLGHVQPVKVTEDKVVFNCFTQDNFGKDGIKYVDYNAIVDCFRELMSTRFAIDTPVAIPRIGCGLAGGNWEFMQMLINDVTQNRLEVWVYEPKNPLTNKFKKLLGI